jgi:hypothetical protein
MHELVPSILHSRLLSALRSPSFAGDGLPERMRSISFALLGLTAAAGLALVAIFAQLSFPVLSPAPLPDEPSLSESIGDARKLTPDRPATAFVTAHPARPAGSGLARGESSVKQTSEGSTGSSGGVGSSPAPTGVEASPPAAVPEPSSGNGTGGGDDGAGKGTGAGADSSPPPVAAPDQAASPPASTPSPKPSPPEPEATASAPKPEPAPGPGNSSSAAAAAHASERGIEASAGAGPPASSATTASTPSPEAFPQPGNGNGLAKGHDK